MAVYNTNEEKEAPQLSEYCTPMSAEIDVNVCIRGELLINTAAV